MGFSAGNLSLGHYAAAGRVGANQVKVCVHAATVDEAIPWTYVFFSNTLPTAPESLQARSV